MRKLASIGIIFFVVLLTCLRMKTPGPVIVSAETTPVTELTVSVGDRIEVELQAIAPVEFHSIGFNVVYPKEMLAPVMESGKPRFIKGDLFAGKVSSDVANPFDGYIYVMRVLERGTVPESGSKVVGKLYFDVTAIGQEGMIELANIKASIYDDSSQGYASLQTAAENMKIIFSSPAPIGIIKVKAIVRKVV